MRKLIIVAVLTASQFTAFPFFAIVAANTARQEEARQADRANVTIVYKTSHDMGFETL